MSKVKLSPRAEAVLGWIKHQDVTPALEPGSSKIDWIPDQSLPRARPGVRDDSVTLSIRQQTLGAPRSAKGASDM